MSNPVFSSFNNGPTQTSLNSSSSWKGLFNQIKNSSNPNAMMQQLLTSSPRFQEVRNYINQNGGDAKTAFYNLAAQKGIDPNNFLNQLNQLM